MYVICYITTYNKSKEELDIADSKCTSPESNNQLQERNGSSENNNQLQGEKWQLKPIRLQFDQ